MRENIKMVNVNHLSALQYESLRSDKFGEVLLLTSQSLFSVRSKRSNSSVFQRQNQGK